jgi:valyl-tRNA synthetase
LLLTAPWPDLPPDLHDSDAAAEMDWVVAANSAIRSVRSEMNVPAAAKVALLVKDAAPSVETWLERHGEHVRRLARVEDIKLTTETPAASTSVVVQGATLFLKLGDVVDLEQEKVRLKKEIDRLDAELGKFAVKLSNPGFLAKAKLEVIEEQREREADTRRDRDRLRTVYDGLEPAA